MLASEGKSQRELKAAWKFGRGILAELRVDLRAVLVELRIGVDRSRAVSARAAKVGVVEDVVGFHAELAAYALAVKIEVPEQRGVPIVDTGPPEDVFRRVSPTEGRRIGRLTGLPCHSRDGIHVEGLGYRSLIFWK